MVICKREFISNSITAVTDVALMNPSVGTYLRQKVALTVSIIYPNSLNCDCVKSAFFEMLFAPNAISLHLEFKISICTINLRCNFLLHAMLAS